jgi:hypothetical protein
MGISTERTNEDWNPREFLVNKSYTELELDALKVRGILQLRGTHVT